MSLDFRKEALKHIKRLEAYARKVEQAYEKANKELSRIAVSVNHPVEELFKLKDYPEIKARVDKVIQELHDSIEVTILNGEKLEWGYANKVNDTLAKTITGLTASEAAESVKYKRYFNQNTSALAAFQKRKESGLNLSQRVWNLTDQYKRDMELGLSVGISDGRSAAQLSRDLRSYLNEPEKLFRRVRNEHGNLVLSKNAASYHPGQGVYRSSYKNALRTARTEINMSYRAADQERWAQMNFVLGYKIARSNNPYPCPVCETLQGNYPKDFIWSGWHPQCYDEQSEVLTNRGWQLFRDVKESDLIFSLNPATRTPEWVGISLHLARWHCGEMIRFHNRSLDCLVTPEHEMVYLNKSNGDIRRKPASEYRKEQGAFYRGCEWNGEERKTININGVELDFDKFCQFMGYWLSDGSTIRTAQIVIAQRSSDPNHKNILECVEAMGFRTQYDNDKINFYCTPLCGWLKQFGTCEKKYIPEEIKAAGSRQIKIFLDAFISCDGHVRPGKSFVGSRGTLCVPNNDERVYFTTSKQMSADIGELLLKVGKRPSYYVDKTAGKEHEFKNGTYTINYDLIRISECSSITASVFKKDVVKYHGMVYDVTLEKNAIMYIRRNGKCFWGSNCRCVITPILQDMDAFLADEEPTPIKDVPDNFKEWTKNNRERIEKARERGTEPYWVKDNKDVIDEILSIGKGSFTMNASSADWIRDRGYALNQRAKMPTIDNADQLVELYNSSPLAGYDIQQFDKEFTDIFETVGGRITYRSLDVAEGKGRFSFWGKWNDEDIRLTRSFRIENGMKTVHHDLFEIPDALQGKGISKNVFKSLYEQYQKAGVQSIDTFANLSVGGYTWARYGFSAKRSEIEHIISRRLDSGRITQDNAADALKVVGNYFSSVRSTDKFPMNLLVGKDYGKDLLLGSDWAGSLDLTDNAQRAMFEKYLRQ